MRHALYFSTIHNQADLGSMGMELSKAGERKYGETEWKEHIQQVQESWDRIEKFVEEYIKTNNIHINKIRLYQDGLPIAGEIGLKIVKDVAKQGSKNYQILESLISRGAYLEEAESKELLLEEYKNISRIIQAKTPAEQLQQSLLYKGIAEELLNKRDNHIAKKINTTLNKGELGLIFFGGEHSIVDKLDKDITCQVIQEFNNKISTKLRNHD